MEKQQTMLLGDSASNPLRLPLNCPQITKHVVIMSATQTCHAGPSPVCKTKQSKGGLSTASLVNSLTK